MSLQHDYFMVQCKVFCILIYWNAIKQPVQVDWFLCMTWTKILVVFISPWLAHYSSEKECRHSYFLLWNTVWFHPNASAEDYQPVFTSTRKKWRKQTRTGRRGRKENKITKMIEFLIEQNYHCSPNNTPFWYF